jgi:hypothetical protein
LLSEFDPVDAHHEFEQWVDDVAAWLETELGSPSLAAVWSGLPYSALVSGNSYHNEPRAWTHFRAVVSERMAWLGQAIAAHQGANSPSESGKEMSNDEISDEGRKARFARWEKLGLDAVKQDLATGGHRLIGGPPQVRALAREWVRMKEEQAKQNDIAAQVVVRALGLEPQSLRDMLENRGTELDRILRDATRSPDTYVTATTPTRSEQSTPIPAPNEKTAELLTLKPGFWGMSIDLKEATRRLRRRFKKS